MRDPRKVDAQKWLNLTYGGKPGFPFVEENGLAGTKLSKAFVCALQLEIGLNKLGITECTGFFGDKTIINSPTISQNSHANSNLVKLLQHAFWCKGYRPGNVTGIFNEETANAVIRIKNDCLGTTGNSDEVDGKWWKAILNSDAYILLNRGTNEMRKAQQFLNLNYGLKKGIIPTDGIYSRDVNRLLIFALQMEIGIPLEEGTFNFGPKTLSMCPNVSNNCGNHNLIKIIQIALNANNYRCEINGIYDLNITNLIRDFQSFMKLEVTEIADKSTIKSLLTSNGDPNRSAKACDCSTILNYNKAKALRDAGYICVGRYLTGTVGGGRPKNLTKNELDDIFKAGLRVFIIYQDGGHKKEYFQNNPINRGHTDAEIANNTSLALGLPKNTIIYFACDYDFVDYEINEMIIPYFEGIYNKFHEIKSIYQIGVYGSRNICTKLLKKGYTITSFVGDMSTGYSGNLGFPMPRNWAFDQFYEFTFSKNNESFGLDKDAYSGLDPGVGNLNLPVDIKINKDIVIYPETIVFQSPLLTIKTKLEAHFNKTISLSNLDDLKHKINVNINLNKEEFTKINLISFLMNNNFEYKMNIDPKSLAVSLVTNNIEHIIKSSIKGVTITQKVDLGNGVSTKVNAHFGFVDSYVEIVYSKKIDLGSGLNCNIEYTIKITGSNLHLCYAFAVCYEYCLKYCLEALISELKNGQKIPDIVITSLEVGTIVKNLIDGIREKINDCLKMVDKNKALLIPVMIIGIAAIILLIIATLPEEATIALGAVITTGVGSLLGALANLIPKIPTLG